MPKLVSLKRLSRRKSSSDPDDSDMDDHTIHYEGFLERRSGVMKTYKRAWFQLHGKELRHYKTNPKWESSAPKGTFNVAEIQTVKAMSTQNRHIIQIITPKGTVCLSGESASYCEEWATHLRQAMQRAKKSATSISVPSHRRGGACRCGRRR
ncbi:dual adapter for phosphotyrosine and 3-phosphotyrosine and 3-phosphoinositide-like [Ptychodera flava]|uniref:dual adapter for phosphotyrosine and 3-phosphotyrosine and 3-phosphoinositide-like n=1 Tax=Ptychodera flava TaxID=63121 RepID=UPI003969D3E1